MGKGYKLSTKSNDFFCLVDYFFAAGAILRSDS